MLIESCLDELFDVMKQIASDSDSYTSHELARCVNTDCHNMIISIRNDDDPQPDEFGRDDLLSLAAICIQLARRIRD